MEHCSELGKEEEERSIDYKQVFSRSVKHFHFFFKPTESNNNKSKWSWIQFSSSRVLLADLGKWVLPLSQVCTLRFHNDWIPLTNTLGCTHQLSKYIYEFCKCMDYGRKKYSSISQLDHGTDKK